MKLETKMKVEKYLPWLYCCNEGSLKLNVTVIIQTIVIALIVGIVSSIIASKIAITQLSTEIAVIKECMLELKEKDNKLDVEDRKQFELIMQNREDNRVMRERQTNIDTRINDMAKEFRKR